MKVLIGLLIALLPFSFLLGQNHATAFADARTKEIISIGWYPNPVKVGDRISIEVTLAEKTEMRTELLDALGRKVFELFATYPMGKSRQAIYTQDLQPGVYFVRITTDEGSETDSIIIE